MLMGRVKVFAQFDHEKFFELALESGLNIQFVRGKEAAQIKQAKLSGPLIEYGDDRFIRTDDRRGKTMVFGAVFRSVVTRF